MFSTRKSSQTAVAPTGAQPSAREGLAGLGDELKARFGQYLPSLSVLAATPFPKLSHQSPELPPSHRELLFRRQVSRGLGALLTYESGDRLKSASHEVAQGLKGLQSLRDFSPGWSGLVSVLDQAAPTLSRALPRFEGAELFYVASSLKGTTSEVGLKAILRAGEQLINQDGMGRDLFLVVGNAPTEVAETLLMHKLKGSLDIEVIRAAGFALAERFRNRVSVGTSETARELHGISQSSLEILRTSYLQRDLHKTRVRASVRALLRADQPERDGELLASILEASESGGQVKERILGYLERHTGLLRLPTSHPEFVRYRYSALHRSHAIGRAILQVAEDVTVDSQVREVARQLVRARERHMTR